MEDFNLTLLAKQAWRLMNRLRRGEALLGLSLIKPNLLRRIATGAHMRICNDAWIPGLPGNMIQFERPASCQHLKVADMLEVDGGDWDPRTLQRLFLEQKIAVISTIKPRRGVGRDKIIWSTTMNGEYSIKIGYHSLQTTQDAIDLSLWKLDTFRKIKSFLWKRYPRMLCPRRTTFVEDQFLVVKTMLSVVERRRMWSMSSSFSLMRS